jgi:hypothetical protein
MCARRHLGMQYAHTALLSLPELVTNVSGISTNITTALGSIRIGGMVGKRHALEYWEGGMRAGGPRCRSQAVFGTEVMPTPPQATMGIATGTVTGSQSHVVVAVMDLGWRLGQGPRARDSTMLPPFRDSQITDLGAEKWYGYQVEYAKHASVQRKS